MTPPVPPLQDDPVLLLNAYLDGELDLANALEMERRIAADPTLAAERDRIEALRQVLRERMPREMPSPALRMRIETAVGMNRRRLGATLRSLAASITLTAVVASSLTWLVLDRNRPDATTNEIVSAHIRALMAPQPSDVTSSERHTVKPWFNSRIPRAPRVINLTDAGYPLAGGRIDVIDRIPSPTIVYRRRQHVISLTGTGADERPDTDPKSLSMDGYNVVTWIQNGVTYWAVSDLNSRELGEFSRLFRTAPADQ